jgi:hypothetical protein
MRFMALNEIGINMPLPQNLPARWSAEVGQQTETAALGQQQPVRKDSAGATEGC